MKSHKWCNLDKDLGLRLSENTSIHDMRMNILWLSENTSIHDMRMNILWLSENTSIHDMRMNILWLSENTSIHDMRMNILWWGTRAFTTCAWTFCDEASTRSLYLTCLNIHTSFGHLDSFWMWWQAGDSLKKDRQCSLHTVLNVSWFSVALFILQQCVQERQQAKVVIMWTCVALEWSSKCIRLFMCLCTLFCVCVVCNCVPWTDSFSRGC